MPAPEVAWPRRRPPSHPLGGRRAETPAAAGHGPEVEPPPEVRRPLPHASPVPAGGPVLPGAPSPAAYVRTCFAPWPGTPGHARVG